MKNSATLSQFSRLSPRSYLYAFLWVSLWVNVSESVRYFAFVMPKMRESFAILPNVAPMDFGVFGVWMIWGSILVAMTVFFSWLYMARFGDSLISAVAAGTLCWLFFFVLFWLGALNMGLAKLEIVIVALPWAWAELIIAALIMRWSFRRF